MIASIPGWNRLRPYQVSSVELLAADRRRLLWATTGAGKSAILLAAWGRVGIPYPALFVTKAIGRHVFSRDAAWVLGRDYAPGVLWSGETRGSGVHGRGAKKTYTSLSLALSERYAVTTNYELLGARYTELTGIPWKLVVFDEAHELKGGYQKPKRDRNGSLHLLRYNYARRLADVVRARGGRVWSATATPIVDRRRDLFAQLDVVYPGAFGTSWHFLHRFCNAFRDEWGGLNSAGESNTEELMGLLEGRAIMIDRASIASQLPRVQRDVCLVSPEVEVYRKMGGGIETALDRAAEITEPFVLDEAAEYLSGGLKVVLITTRRRLAYSLSVKLTDKRFLARLPRKHRESVWGACVTGEIEPKRRAELVTQFNDLDHGPAYLVATIKSVGSSMDIHRVDGMIVGAFPDRPGDLVQLEGRAGRLSGWPMTIRYLVAERTIAEKYKEMLFGKFADVNRLGADTQGDGGAFQALGLMGSVNEEEILAGLRDFLEKGE